ncbi:MAG: hypothetical protein ABJA16_11060 [Nakamurella sp.]
MDRRATGGVMLLLAVLCVLVVPRLTAVGVTGAAAVEPGPPPLPAGTCVRTEVTPGVTDGGWMRASPGLEAVDCAEPHWGEVAVLDQRTDANERPVPCRGPRIDSYLVGPSTPSGSTAAVRVDATALGPDARQFAGGQRWTSCLVHSDAPSTGSLAGIAMTGDPPPSVGRCYQDGFASFDSLLAPCPTPHRSELFRYLTIDLDRQPVQPDVDSWCAAALVAATGRSDLAGLAVVTDVFAWFDDRQSRFVDLPVPIGARGATALCGVQVVDDRLLISSLRRIGEAPLPFV